MPWSVKYLWIGSIPCSIVGAVPRLATRSARASALNKLCHGLASWYRQECCQESRCRELRSMVSVPDFDVVGFLRHRHDGPGESSYRRRDSINPIGTGRALRLCEHQIVVDFLSGQT